MKSDDNQPINPSLPGHFFFSLLAACRFLTILPVSWRSGKDIQYLPYAIYFFPMVGIIIGAVVGCAAIILNTFLPSSVVGSVIVVLLALASGGLHLDGLADSCDGLLSSRSPERMLEIMRDSNVGAMGVIGIVSVFLIKFSSLFSIETSQLFPAIVLIALSGRSGILLMMAVLRYVRGEGGIGTRFVSMNLMNVRKAAVTGMMWYGVCLLFIPLFSVLAATFMTIATVLLFSWFCQKKNRRIHRGHAWGCM